MRGEAWVWRRLVPRPTRTMRSCRSLTPRHKCPPWCRQEVAREHDVQRDERRVAGEGEKCPQRLSQMEYQLWTRVPRGIGAHDNEYPARRDRGARAGGQNGSRQTQEMTGQSEAED